MDWVFVTALLIWLSLLVIARLLYGEFLWTL